MIECIYKAKGIAFKNKIAGFNEYFIYSDIYGVFLTPKLHSKLKIIVIAQLHSMMGF